MKAVSKRALVTGGGTGMGYAIANRLLTRGVSVMICARRGDVLASAAKKLRETTDGRCEFVAIDLGDADGPAAAVEACVSAFDGIDILVNNAGIADYGKFEDITAEAWNRSHDIMLRAPMLATQAAASHMATAGGGKVVNITSINGLVSEPQSAMYSAAKAGLISLTRSCAIDLAPLGIRTNAIAPGWVRTPMSEPFLGGIDPDNVSGLNTLDRVGQPDEIATVAEFLALDAPEFLSGQTIFVDGGQSVMAPMP